MKRLGWALAALVALTGPSRAEIVTVFAAASLKTALDEIGTVWSAQSDHAIRVVPAGSAMLARQIEAGAPADLFISANPQWMDHLEALGLVDPDTRFDLAGNRLALIAHEPASPATIDDTLPLADLLGSERLAIALVDAVPAGIYGKAALQSLGLWAEAAPRLAQTDNVRAALALVATGATPLGLVYATDARADRRVTLIGLFPAHTHPPIRYPVAALEDGSPAALAFLQFLQGGLVRDILRQHGFTDP
ncbi:MAG: molybdate ABC transporter substrate-binding protein [Pseudomonadota bacterium]